MSKVLAASLSVVVCLAVTGCKRHQLPPDVADRVAHSLSLARTDRSDLGIYFDTSGSMRGFALAATTNQRGSGDAFQSFLLALQTLPHEPPPRDTEPKKTASESPVSDGRRQVVLFGGDLRAQAAFDDAVDSALGRRDPANVTANLGPSSDCTGTKWNGAAISRERIDRFFSEGTTCLDQVFRDIRSKGRNRLNILVTDAEQTASLNDPGCPNPQNLGTIQSYLNAWSRDGGFAAIIAASLPYQPWTSTAAKAYCGCQERLLFTYILSPTAAAAEQVFAHIRSSWKGTGSGPTYLPLIPRPAVSYSVRVVTAADEANSLVFSSDARPTQFEPAEVGRLPEVWIQMREPDGQVAVNIEKAGFESPSMARGSQIDWSKSTIEWRDPVPLGNDGVPQPSGSAGALSLVRLNEPFANEATPAVANMRMTRFLGQSHEPEREVKPSGSRPLRLRIRRTGAAGSGAGCQWYLLEAIAPKTDYATQIAGTMSQLSSSTCLNWDAVRVQVATAFQEGPFLRLLLHVDY